MSEKEWHFNPYHQRIDEAMESTPDAPPADTEWDVYEVFAREKRGDHPVHVGSIHASDSEMALVLAKEQYARRGHVVQLWVVPARYIAATPLQDADIFEHVTDRSYREAYGYKVARKVRALREARRSETTDE